MPTQNIPFVQLARAFEVYDKTVGKSPHTDLGQQPARVARRFHWRGLLGQSSIAVAFPS